MAGSGHGDGAAVGRAAPAVLGVDIRQRAGELHRDGYGVGDVLHFGAVENSDLKNVVRAVPILYAGRAAGPAGGCAAGGIDALSQVIVGQKHGF